MKRIHREIPTAEDMDRQLRNIRELTRDAERATRRRTGHSGRKAEITLAAFAVLALLAAFIWLNEAFFHIDGIPSWKELYSSAGLSKETAAAEYSCGAAVHFIDVGQGDCAFITADGLNILIDCGEYEYSGRVISYLKSAGAEKLDYIIVSHPHSDHFGGMYRIAENFETKSIILPEIREDMLPVTTSYINLIETAEEHGIPIDTVCAGKVIELSDKARIEIDAPTRIYDDLNNNSVVLRFVYGENAFLFCGDIEEEAETDILSGGADISADVIKAPHHGSHTSGNKLFLQSVSADYAVFCVGEGNDYGHPHRDVVNLYKKLGAKILRTDTDGCIVFCTDGSSLSFKKEKNAE